MRLIKIPMLASLLFVLPACSASTRYVSPPPAPRLAQPDSALIKDCDRPVDIGEKALTQEQTEGFWIDDRKALIECRRSKTALRDFYADRDSRLVKPQ
ncbi:dehydrogenase [Rhizobium rhizogenes]|uniref:dehydrogenase n=1 Tax=Rhizobium rhizogenes TaxID=359 RepID=UPI00193E5850|nr:dehydrogenase [Rhizobium rhizogenes]QRM36933.1 dehydrogenase [Rhizobium rhizogenes]